MSDLDKKIQELIAEFINSEISEPNLKSLEQYANKEGLSLEEFIRIYNGLEIYKIAEPGGSLDQKFYAMLSEQKSVLLEKTNRWLRISETMIKLISLPQIPRPAYGLIVLLLGFLFGNLLIPNRANEKEITLLNQEVREMRELIVLSMIKGNEATDRIKAVNYVNQMESADSKVIDALFKTLNNDKNLNVRLSSLEALKRFSHLSDVREGLINSLNEQNSPIILIELADFLIQLQDKKSIEELKELLQKNNLDPNLRLLIESGVKTSI